MNLDTIFFLILAVLGFGMAGLCRAATVMQRRLDAAEEASLEDEDMKETQKLNP